MNKVGKKRFASLLIALAMIFMCLPLSMGAEDVTNTTDLPVEEGDSTEIPVDAGEPEEENDGEPEEHEILESESAQVTERTTFGADFPMQADGLLDDLEPDDEEDVSNITQLRNAVAAAPTDGSLLAINVTSDFDFNGTFFNVPTGSNILLRSKDENDPRTIKTISSSSYIRVMGTLTLGNIILDGNSTGRGITVANNGTFTMTNGELKNFIGQSASGAAITGESSDTLNIKITGGKIHHNTTTSLGTIYLRGGNLEISGGEIYENHNTGSSNGSAIYVDAQEVYFPSTVYNPANLTVSGGKIHDNSTQNGGGAIWARSSVVNISGGDIYNNKSSAGGAVYIQKISGVNTPRSTLHLRGGKIYNNEADSMGGAFYCGTDTDVEITGGEIYQNKTTTGSGNYNGGGAFYLGGGCITNMNGGNIHHNESANNGGAFFLQSGLNMTGGTVTDNEAATEGGAIYVCRNVVSDLNITLDGITMNDNTAGKSGGAIHHWDQGVLSTLNPAKLTVQNNTKMNGNTAAEDGGAIYITRRATVNITDSELSGNEAQNGGAIYTLMNNVTVKSEDTTYSSNKAAEDGGALALLAGSTTGMYEFNRCVFMDNSAEKDGGAIWITNLAALKMNVAQFKNNRASKGYHMTNTVDRLSYNSRIKNVSEVSHGFDYAYNNHDIVYTKGTVRFTVSFDSDGGSAVPSQSVEENKFAVEPNPAPTKQGYTFKHWEFEGAKWNFTTDPVTRDMELIAIWEEAEYTITFNTGVGGSAIAPQTKKYGQKVDDPGIPTRAGYTFSHWEYNNTTWNFQTDTVTGDMELTAVWTEDIYNITFNTGVGGSTVAPQTKKYGQKVDDPGIPTRAGYTFSHWEYNNTTWNFQTDTVTGDMELTAVWTEDIYNITFNTGVGGSAIAPQTKKYGQKVDDPGIPTRAGYTFSHWEYNNATWNFLTDTVAGDMELTAVWTEDIYNITFNTGVGGSTVAPQTKKYGQKVDDPGIPTRAGYTFSHWEYNNATWNFQTDTVTGDMELIAAWNQNPNPVTYYTVIYNSNGGSPVDPVRVTAGSMINRPNTTRAGYTLVGWFTQPSGGRAWDFGFDRVNEDMTLYARWNADPQPPETPNPDYTYTVSFDSNGADVAASPRIKTVVAPATTIDALPSAPTRTGHDFVGWYTGRDGGAPFTANTPVNRDMVVYARWRAQYFRLTFETNGANTPTPTGQSIAYGQLANPVADPQKSGSAFLGWNTAEDGSGEFWSFATSTMPSRNITLYAQWREDENALGQTSRGENGTGGSSNGNGDSSTQSGPPSVKIGDLEIPLYGFGGEYWSLINLLLVVIGTLVSAALLSMIFATKNRDELYKKHRNWRITAMGAALASILVFLLTQDLSSKMVLVDEWSPAIVILFGAQVVFWLLGRKDSGSQQEPVENPR